MEEETRKYPSVHTPIESYLSQAQLDDSLREWQHRLYLDSWIIKAVVVDEIIDDGEVVNGACGYNTMTFESSQAYIQILSDRSFEKMKPLCEKLCQEKTLVHELLHCLYDWMDGQGSYEGTYLEATEHQKLDNMAKSLIMAKYRLDYDYFRR